MNREQTDLDLLTRRTKQGDVNAQAELRKQLEPGMVMLIRQTLRSGSFRTPIGQRILEESRRVAAFTTPPRELPVFLLTQVARNLCSRLVDRMQSDPFGPQHLRETVVA